MIRVILQARVIDPRNLVVLLEVPCDGERAVADSVHPQRQGLDALQDEKGVEGRNRRPGIAQRHDAGATDVGRGSECLGVNHAVITQDRVR
jgi:hypothetical protein